VFERGKSRTSVDPGEGYDPCLFGLIRSEFLEIPSDDNPSIGLIAHFPRACVV
jgi:hypothetical protein